MGDATYETYQCIHKLFSGASNPMLKTLASILFPTFIFYEALNTPGL